MKKYLICLAFTFLFSQTDVMSVEMINVESGAILIDMSNLDVDEKKDLFASLIIKTNKFILHSRNYSMEVQKIILMHDDSVKVELLDSWWWNRPKKPLFYNASSMESMPSFNEPSHQKMIDLNDIIAVQVLKKNSINVLTFPLLIVVILMELLSL